MDRFDNLTLRERITAHLRAEILSNHIAPGTLLQEVPLAEQLGTSRGPIREALGALAAEGLVTITPRRGAVVTTLTKEEFRDAYQVREVLESLGARLAVPIIGTDALGAMTAAIWDMTRAAELKDVDLFFDANTAFHGALMDASGNRKLVEIHRRLVSQMGPYRRPSARLRGNLERSIAEHQAILDAVQARDVERATALVLEHVRVPQQRLETLTDEQFAQESGQTPDATNGATPSGQA
jgi:DNA-binding GntR family transcriptional regulator